MACNGTFAAACLLASVFIPLEANSPTRDGAGPPERVKAGQGLTGSARAPGAVPDGVRDSFTPSVAATKFPAGLWLCRHCTPAARLGLGTAVWCWQSSLEGADG